MILRKSRFVHRIPLGTGRVLLVHAVSQVRLAVDRDVDTVLDFFVTPHTVPDAYDDITGRVGYDKPAIASCVTSLLERGFLSENDADGELAEIADKLGPTYGRDPVELLDTYRRALKEGSQPYWSAATAHGLVDLQGGNRRLDVILLGECDLQMESDFLRREASRRGIDLRVAATFPHDVRLAAEHKHDAVIIGALRARHSLAIPEPASDGGHSQYSAEVSHILEQLRKATSAPILIDNLPEPTVQPLGLAERGLNGHRTRFRLTNVMLANLVESFADVHVVDVAAALASEGAETLLDDGLVGFTHMGSPGWLLQRPDSEKAAVHGQFPDIAALASTIGADPYRREALVARVHMDALSVVLGIGRKKCIIVDLDGVLWPGVLAETGSPFAWHPATSGTFSYVGLYFGLHEALLSLKRRGIVLACVSKNDEAVVRELWAYAEHYPKSRLLTPGDFVTWRVNWRDKVENIRSIAEELGFALDTFLFVDDHPIERDRVRQRLPEVEVWGENPFDLRRRLLNDPRLQVPRITAETAARTDLVKAQLGRQHLRAEVLDESQYRASLQIECRVDRVSEPGKLDRIAELFLRTTQFNTTGRKFSVSELVALIEDKNAFVFMIEVSDRFGDQGLVGAAIVTGGDVVGLVLSCRVIGLGVEHEFMRQIIDGLKPHYRMLTARIVETSRNTPVRNLFRDHGFIRAPDGSWALDLEHGDRQISSPRAVA